MTLGGENPNVKDIRSEGNATVVALQGEIDMHHTPGVHRALSDAYEKKPSRLVVNLEDVTYMDSSGIGTLVEALRKLKVYNGRLVLCGMNERVHSVFEITRLDQFFTIVATEQEALSA
jgi:anti-sigma B factor antagonist